MTRGYYEEKEAELEEQNRRHLERQEEAEQLLDQARKALEIAYNAKPYNSDKAHLAHDLVSERRGQLIHAVELTHKSDIELAKHQELFR